MCDAVSEDILVEVGAKLIKFHIPQSTSNCEVP